MMHTTPTGLVTESVEKLAEALHALGGCKRCQWAQENMWPCKSADRYRDQADTLITSGAARPAAEVRAEALREFGFWLEKNIASPAAHKEAYRRAALAEGEEA